MKNFLIVGLIFITLSACSVKKAHIEEINSRLASQEERITILTEQIMLLDFESIRVAQNQLQSQRTEGRSISTTVSPTLTSDTSMSTTPSSLPSQTSTPNPLSETQRGASETDINRVYNEGMRHYERRDFAAAIRSFNSIPAQYPNHELVANAHYWTGESYYGMGDFTAAREAFQIVLDRYPNSNKAVDSQVKIAMTWIRQNRPEQARVILEAVRREHPNYERMSVVEQNLRLVRG